MRTWLVAASVGAATGLALATFQSATGPAEARAAQGSGYEALDVFAETYELVRGAYVEEVEDQQLVTDALNGMLTALDPHSSYLAPAGYDEMREDTSGKFGGLGIEVTLDESGLVKVVAPIDDTPAAAAGIQSGDLISHIDDEPVLGLTLSQAVERMRGEVGEGIKLGVLREGLEEPLEITLTRAVITVFPVRARAEGDIGYLRITKFNEQTATDLLAKFAEVTAEIGEDQVKGYIIDLRNNPGGLLNQAVEVSDAFLESGEIVSTRGRDPNSGQRFNAEEGDLAGGKPIVVLVNQGSASASEIVAGALQDHRRAVVVGVKSFGKGSVQTIMRLNNGGALRLTTARYYTPSGRSIQARGIEPDVVVEQLKVEAPQRRRGMAESNLRGHLGNPDGEEAGAAETPEAGASAATLRETDYQLAYALDLLRGVSVFDRQTAQ